MIIYKSILLLGNYTRMQLILLLDCYIYIIVSIVFEKSIKCIVWSEKSTSIHTGSTTIPKIGSTVS